LTRGFLDVLGLQNSDSNLQLICAHMYGLSPHAWLKINARRIMAQ
jgi:hypothetical protein